MPCCSLSDRVRQTTRFVQDCWNMTDNPELVGLVLLSLALFISLCLNVLFCIRCRDICRDTDQCCCMRIYTGESLSQDEGHCFQNLSYEEQEENPHNHREQQENPIYGNISSDRRDSVEVCYETMTVQHASDRMKSLVPDLNYASLDLKMAKKRKKKIRQQQGHAQGQNKVQDELTVHLTPSVNGFLEVEADVDADLPSRDNSTMVSHSSIYLNSQQIAQEAEEMERERGMNMEKEGIRRSEDEKGEQERNERKDNNGSVCTQQSEVEAIQTGTQIISSAALAMMVTNKISLTSY